MAQAVKKTTKTTKPAAKKADLKVVDPVGNSGIPRPAAKGFDGRKITLITKDVPANRRIAPQALIILNTLDALGGTSTQGAVVAALLENGLKTVQSPKRIFDFYRKMLVEEEYIKLD